MDVDMELDGDFMQKFSSLGTTDRDVLISEFQRLAGSTVNPTACAFFLDMNNWNLQAAIGSYYDMENPSVEVRVPSMSFIRDVTIGEGESVPPDTDFTKTWRVQNSGSDAWPIGSFLKFLYGHQLSSSDRQQVSALPPGEIADISIQMHSPKECGLYQGQWRMCTGTGVYFGETIWVILEVKEGGILGLTQQLSSMGNLTFTHRSPDSRDVAIANPFGSPTKVDAETSMGDMPDGTSTNPPSSPFRTPLFQTPSNVQSMSNPSSSVVVPQPSFPVMNHHTNHNDLPVFHQSTRQIQSTDSNMQTEDNTPANHMPYGGVS